jgi:hypothetical protein
MPTQIVIEDDAQILVELKGGRGVVDVSRANEQELAQKSAEAFNSAMATIHTVAKRTAATIRSLKIVDQPDTIEMTFGLKLTSEANALIVNAGVEAQIEVKLTWNNAEKKHEDIENAQ